MPGFASGKALDVVDAFAADAQHALEKMSDADYCQVIQCSCPGPGSCAGLFTACSMACVTEALGLSLPGMATAHAVDVKKLRLCVESGREIMNLIRDNITARDIMTECAFANALAVDMAIGASTNTVLHIPAIAREAGVEITLNMIDEISQRTPNLVKISPSSAFKMFDFDRAGGVPTVMKELQSLLEIDQATVEGNVDARITLARPADGNVIRAFNNPYSPTGGIMVLKGNLAPSGSVMKASGVDSGVKEFTGQAAVFENEEDATAFIKSGQLKPGTVLVIRNEGPAGGPGMREMLYPTSAVRGLKMDKEVALITDGRFSGGTAGICIGHVEPEAFNAGPIAAVNNGDKIVINLVAKTVTLCVEEQEIFRRLTWKPPTKELPKGGILEKFRNGYRNSKA